MRVLIAVLAAGVLSSVGIGMLRSLRGGPRSVPLPEVVAPPPDVRVTFWCETCGTEVLLLRKGSEAPPRHCGEGMTRREEIAHTSN